MQLIVSPVEFRKDGISLVDAAASGGNKAAKALLTKAKQDADQAAAAAADVASHAEQAVFDAKQSCRRQARLPPCHANSGHSS